MNRTVQERAGSYGVRLVDDRPYARTSRAASSCTCSRG